jgi:hypothetical protein
MRARANSVPGWNPSCANRVPGRGAGAGCREKSSAWAQLDDECAARRRRRPRGGRDEVERDVGCTYTVRSDARWALKRPGSRPATAT